MSQTSLQYVAQKNRFAFKTNTGFALEHGVCAVRTNRGELRPLPQQASGKGVQHAWRVRRLSGCAFEFRQSLRNLCAAPLDISAIRMFDGMLRMEGAGWRMAHSELFSQERYFDGYTSCTGGLLAPVPGTEGEFGLSENLPFPGIIFTHPERGTVLMGVLSQERCKPCWTLRPSGRHIRLVAEERFSGVPCMRVREGREWLTEHWVLLFTHAGLEDAVDAYYRLLRQRMDFPGADSILRRAILWGSWNYNRRPRGFGDVTHDWVVANARALKKLAPDKPRFVMIDDGYRRGCASQVTDDTWFASALEIFHPDGKNPPHDPKLFPQGMRHTAQAIRRAGAGAAIWTTPRIHLQSALARERPDLLLAVADRPAFSRKTAYLDYSIPEAREYTRRAWHTYCHEWGYQGIKLDFWSLPFEIPEVRYRNHDHTAIELRNLFLQDLRECIPPGGYMLNCVVCNSGNPFPGRYADAVRISMDIGAGGWTDICRSAACLTTSAPFFRHDCCLGDADSIGWCDRSTADENRLWATMALLCGGVCEIGGDLTNMSAEAQAMLRAVTRIFKPARRTLSDLAGPGVGRLPANHLVLERDDGVYEAHLNWMWCPRIVNLSGTVRDVWTGRRLGGRCKIPPHGAILFKKE